MRLYDLVEFLDDYLNVKEWEDKSKNGLQVEGREEVKKAVFAVDACMDVFVKAKELNADIVIVHHGLIWNGIESVKGIVKRRLRFLLENEISLYAAHLPLDAHPSVGNNAQLLNLIGASIKGNFGEYRGRPIGFWGEFDDERSIDEIARSLKTRLNADIRVLDFGTDGIKSVGAVSGKGAFAIAEAIERGLDLFLTGEAEHGVYHVAKECKINVIFAGHYATETLGVKALMNVVRERFGIDVEFVDVPTGL